MVENEKRKQSIFHTFARFLNEIDFILMIKKLILFLFAFAMTYLADAQSSVSRRTYIINGQRMSAETQIDADEFFPVLMDSILIDQINYVLAERDCEPLQYRRLLFTVANEQSEYMAMMADTDPNAKLKEPVAERMRSYGGSNNAAELTTKINVVKNKQALTYFKMAEELVFRWMSNSKTASLLESTNYQYIGASSHIDAEGKKVFVSVVLGNFRSFNEGMRNRDQLKVPYTLKNNGLSEYDPDVCKRINRMTNLFEFRDALKVEDRQVFIELNNAKPLQKLLRNKTDALALDILQKEQYACGLEGNILDYNRINHGVMTKPCKMKKVFKKNLADVSKNSHAFKAKIADLPDNIELKNSEINLMIIQDGSVCTSVPKSFIHPIKGTYKNVVKILADTVMINSRFGYHPIPDSADLTFVIPFKGNKADYDVDDIEPFLEALEQPDFTILNMDITAYSSIEGSDSVNRSLQRRRAESIVKALESRQADSITKTIVTDYNWDDFATDIQSTKYRKFANWSIERVQDSIKKNDLAKELEPMLQNHRYARINMRIVYDIKGKNERPFVLRKFHEAAIDSADRIEALSIQKFIMKRVLHGQYDKSVLDEMQIPDSPDFAGLAMNDIWLRYKLGMLKMSEVRERIRALAMIAPNNEYIAFNDLLMRIDYPEGLFRDMSSSIQQGIERLYYTPLRKETVDRLNIRLQLKIIDEVDSLTHVRATKVACVQRIKQIVDIKTETMENSLKLAELFLYNKDYMLTLKILEPWVGATNNMQLLLTYVSLCSLFENMMHTVAFETAMSRIKEIEPETYRRLLDSGDGEGFSLKVFENENIKKEYCEFCNEGN